MERFIKEFKIYCETVDNIKGLDTIKNEIIKNNFDIESLVDLYIDFNNSCSIEIIEQTKELIQSLEDRVVFGEQVESCELRDLYVIVDMLTSFEIKEVFEYSMGELSEFIYNKYNVNPFRGEDLTKEQLKNEAWFTNLCDLLEKYNIC